MFRSLLSTQGENELYFSAQKKVTDFKWMAKNKTDHTYLGWKASCNFWEIPKSEQTYQWTYEEVKMEKHNI